MINNSIAQSNNFKTNIKLKWKKSAEIADLIFCEINGIAPSFYLALSEAYSESSRTSKMGRFLKNSQRLNTVVFEKISVLDVWLGSEYVSDYPGFFPISINGGCHFESSKNISNVVSILVSRAEMFSLGAIELCSKPV